MIRSNISKLDIELWKPDCCAQAFLLSICPSLPCLTQYDVFADAYPCRYINPQPAATQCDNLNKSQCTESTSCSWCESAAVGNACYTKVLQCPVPRFADVLEAYTSFVGPSKPCH